MGQSRKNRPTGKIRSHNVPAKAVTSARELIILRASSPSGPIFAAAAPISTDRNNSHGTRGRSQRRPKSANPAKVAGIMEDPVIPPAARPRIAAPTTAMLWKKHNLAGDERSDCSCTRCITPETRFRKTRGSASRNNSFRYATPTVYIVTYTPRPAPAKPRIRPTRTLTIKDAIIRTVLFNFRLTGIP